MIIKISKIVKSIFNLFLKSGISPEEVVRIIMDLKDSKSPNSDKQNNFCNTTNQNETNDENNFLNNKGEIKNEDRN